MTPAINLLKKQKIAHSVLAYEHETGSSGYGMEAAEKLDLPPEQVFKTLLVKLDNRQLAVAVIPVSGMLSLKQMARACKARKVTMADKAEAERATGYLVGGISPLGQKKRLLTLIDSSAGIFDTIYVSAGRRGLEISLSPASLASLAEAGFAPIAAHDK